MSVLITFEGPEGSGKSTQAERLVQTLRQHGHDVLLTREPGGTPLGEDLRDLLLNPERTSLTPLAELFLYLAARAQHVRQRIRPALEAGTVVVSDRFSDASVAYQGYGRQLGAGRVRRLNRLATDDLQPDLTVVLDVPLEEGLSRAREGSRKNWETPEGDRLERESLAFHRRVREGYRRLAQEHADRCVLLDGTPSPDRVADRVRRHVQTRLNLLNDD